MITRTYNVLFLCTGNSARSIIAEALLQHYGKGRFRACSTGSHPTGQVNPLALEALRRSNIALEAPRSKSWDKFAPSDSPMMDFVFTVCDSAAGEACPIRPGQPVTAQWGVPDPVTVSGSTEERYRAFAHTLTILKRRIDLFINLPIQTLSALSLEKEVDSIGKKVTRSFVRFPHVCAN